MSRRRVFVVALLLVGVPLSVWIGVAIWKVWKQQAWFALQKQQMATIKRLGEFPPPGWNSDVWSNALVTPHNVWGNVTFSPSYSNISHDEMRSLQSQLERILSETTSANSPEGVDRVFDLLLQRGQRIPFITGYRDEFRQSVHDMKRRSREAETSPDLESNATPVIQENFQASEK